MINLFEQFKIFLKEEGISFIERFGNLTGVNLKVEGNNGILFISVFYVKEKNSLVCFTDFPVRIPKDKRKKIFEFISVLNEQSLISNFILNEDGIVRVKSSLFSCEEKIESESFKRFLYVNFSSLDNHFKKFLALSEINYLPSTQTQISLN